MSDLVVIGIVGHSRAGKDTVANVMTALGGFKRVALADGVREALGALNGPTWELSKEIDAERGNWSHRLAMQLAGTECREDIESSFHWVSHALIKIRYLSAYHCTPSFRFVIPDMRFAHEPNAVRKWVESWGGRFEAWKVVRPGIVGSTGHASETAVDSIPYDLEIRNSGTLADLVRLAQLHTETAAGRHHAD